VYYSDIPWLSSSKLVQPLKPALVASSQQPIISNNVKMQITSEYESRDEFTNVNVKNEEMSIFMLLVYYLYILCLTSPVVRWRTEQHGS